MHLCPACKHPTTKVEATDGRFQHQCLDCGWGIAAAQKLMYEDRMDLTSNTKRQMGWPFIWGMVAGWIYIPVFVFDPYLWLQHSAGPLSGGSIGTYWVCMATYLMAATVLAPSFDADDLAPGMLGLWAGIWMLPDNPDKRGGGGDIMDIVLGVILFPGKIVTNTIGNTWAWFWFWKRSREERA